MPQAQPSATNAKQNPKLYGTRKSTTGTRKMDKAQRSTQGVEQLKSNPLRGK